MMRASILKAAGVLAACVLSGAVRPGDRAAAAPGAGLRSHHHRHPPDPVFVTNPGLANLSVFPVGTFGNVPTLVTNPNLQNPSGIARDSAGNIYAANGPDNSITEYSASASGAPNPIATISGPNTQLNYPVALTLDSAGNIYVANCGSCSGGVDSITVYPAGSNGNVTPSTVITGTATGLNSPGGLALDADKNLYVTNGDDTIGPGSITVYAAGSNGNTAPMATIAGNNTDLFTPAGIVIDSAGNIFVTNDNYIGGDTAGSIETFPPGSNGNVAPANEIYGTCSGLDDPRGIAVDSAGNIYVANDGGGEGNPGNIKVYAAGSQVCATPTATISGASTTLTQPTALILDSSGNIYVTDLYNDSIAVFAAGANGNIAPTQAIADPQTGMSYPVGLALDSNGKIYVTDTGDAGGGIGSVLVYPAGSNADVTPTKTITGGSTKLNYPVAIAIEPSDGIYADNGIYVANEAGGYQGNGSVTVYTQGANGNAAPYYQIAGDSTGDNTALNNPIGVAYRQSYIYVLNATGGSDYAGSITWYYPRLFGWGNVVPLYIVHGSNTGLNYPNGFALDNSGNMYVTNDGSVSGFVDTVTVYKGGTAGGNQAPMATISGSLTQLNMPSGIAVDSSGNIWVANNGSLGGGVDTITVYSAGSNGNVAPAMLLSNGNVVNNAIISGTLTGLSLPTGIAVGG